MYRTIKPLLLVIFSLSLSAMGCGGTKTKEQSGTSGASIFGDWRLCSTDYDLSSPNSYVQIVSFRQTSYTRTRTTYEGQDCGDTSKKVSTQRVVVNYQIDEFNKNEIVTSFVSVEQAIHSVVEVETANNYSEWGYSDWALDTSKDIANRSERAEHPIDFDTSKSFRGHFRIESNNLYFNPQRTDSDSLGDKIPHKRIK